MASKEGLVRIADFDGTFTVETGNRFELAWSGLLSQKLEIPIDDLLPKLDDARSEVLAHPEKYGWNIDGIIVAPPTSDRFLLMNNATRIVVEGLRREDRHPRFLDSIQTERLIEDLYDACYHLAESEFKGGAHDFIEEQHRTGKFVIVTNSRTDSVTHQLERLMGPDNGITVLGNAKKYKVSACSSAIAMPGLPRPAFLDRPYYEQILRALLDESERGVVIGDVAELDLILPLSMGFNGILVTSPRTPVWEVDYVNLHPNGKAVGTLDEAAGYIRSLS